MRAVDGESSAEGFDTLAHAAQPVALFAHATASVVFDY